MESFGLNLLDASVRVLVIGVAPIDDNVALKATIKRSYRVGTKNRSLYV